MTTPQSTYASVRASTDPALQVHVTRAVALEQAMAYAHDLIRHEMQLVLVDDVVAFARKFATFLTPTASDANPESLIQKGS